MKIAVTSVGAGPDSLLDSRFGRTAWFVIHDTETGAFESLENQQNLTLPQGAGIQSAAAVVNAGCGVLISNHCGPKAFDVLKKGGIRVYLAADGTVKECIIKHKNGFLRELFSADVEGHW
ncbi:MAG: NifB/NifX family molybdenum-iron cluster-binding protein [Fibrobacteres bacterium]|nr:NifB/NifX family molybdenum-iron cluster-binding protein [Fibrobacterota bacterium]